MRLFYLSLAVTAALQFGACAIVPADEPVATETINGNYSKLASCAFDRLDAKYPTTFRLNDLRGKGETRVTYEPQAGLASPPMRWWEVDFVRITDISTRAVIKAAPTIQGKGGYTAEFMPLVRECMI